MTKEEISDYIINKKIPVSFVWENDEENYLWIYNGTNKTTTNIYHNNDMIFPNWGTHYSGDISIYYWVINGTGLFNSKKPLIEQCLSDFLIWFELNKHRCKEIKYYDIRK